MKVLINILLIATMMLVIAVTAAALITQALAFDVTPDTQQCGGDGCYDMGYTAGHLHHGIQCPSGHSIAYCIGWDSGAGVDNRYLFTKSEYCQCT